MEHPVEPEQDCATWVVLVSFGAESAKQYERPYENNSIIHTWFHTQHHNLADTKYTQHYNTLILSHTHYYTLIHAPSYSHTTMPYLWESMIKKKVSLTKQEDCFKWSFADWAVLANKEHLNENFTALLEWQGDGRNSITTVIIILSVVFLLFYLLFQGQFLFLLNANEEDIAFFSTNTMRCVQVGLTCCLCEEQTTSVVCLGTTSGKVFFTCWT